MLYTVLEKPFNYSYALVHFKDGLEINVCD